MTRKEALKVAKPILFNTDMVRAIQDGTKTVTRRLIKPQPKYSESGGFTWKGREYGTDLPPTIQGAACNFLVASPYQIGDILYVRETWQSIEIAGNLRYVYKASDEGKNFEVNMVNWAWRPSIHMPKEAARIFLRVTDVRVERLQDITKDGLIAEGAETDEYLDYEEWATAVAPPGSRMITLRDYYSELWNSTVKKSDLAKYGWAANPFVFVISFERVIIDETLQ